MTRSTALASLFATMVLPALAWPTSALAKKKADCPEPGTTVAFAQVMNVAFAADYEGCDVQTTASFVATGVGTMVVPFDQKKHVIFRALPPGVEGAPNPLSGEIDAMYVSVPKDAAAAIFSLQPGQSVELRGGTETKEYKLVNMTMVLFQATSVAPSGE